MQTNRILDNLYPFQLAVSFGFLFFGQSRCLTVFRPNVDAIV